jgi:CSLREA domain-containing protein
MRRCLVGVAVMGALALPAAASAADFHVTTTADTAPGTPCTTPASCSLRGAIEAADAAGGIDTVLIASGSYVLTNGELAVTEGALIERDGAGGTVTIDAGGHSRVFLLTADVTLEDLTLTNGLATDSPNGDDDSDPAQGGAVWSDHALLTTDVVISHSRATSTIDEAQGGGLYISGQPSLSTTTFLDDTASGTGWNSASGGGLYIGYGDQVNAHELTFRDNRATAVDGEALGGGLFSYASPLTLYDATFAGNAATATGDGPAHGGGIASPGIIALVDSRVTANAVSTTSQWARGGGIFVSGPVLTLTDSTVDANTATADGGPSSGVMGGGVATNDSRSWAVLTNSTVIGNTATAAPGQQAYGGGLFLGEGSSITDSTITGNALIAPASANVWGGGLSSTNPPFIVTVTGSIIAGNTQSRGSDCGLGLLSTGGGNVVNFPADDCNFATDVTDVITATPGVGTLGDHGGSTPTALLDATSPGLNRYTGAGCESTDQRGVTRPQGAACDSGAVEMRAAAFSAAPSTVPFGAVTLGSTSAPQAVTVTNDGDLPGTPSLAVGGADAARFSLSGCTAAIDGGQTCAAALTFAPSFLGGAAAQLTGVTPTVALTGTGTAAAGGGGGSSTAGGGGVPQCLDLNLSTAFQTAAATTLDCSATVWNWAIATAPEHGTLGPIGAQGQLTYTPADGFSGDDTFQYVAGGAHGSSAPATVVVHVGPGPLAVTTSSSSAKACTPRTVTIRLNPRGVHFTRVRVSVAGHAIKPTRTRTVWKATFVLKGQPGEQVAVAISGRRTDGKLVTTTRTLSAC